MDHGVTLYRETDFQESLVGSVPQDWEVTRLGDLLTLEYGSGLPERQRNEGPYPVYGSNGIVGYHDRALVEGPGLIVGRKGTISGVVWSDEDFWPIDTTYYVVLKGKLDLRWAYYKLSSLGFERFNMATGVPGLNRNIVYEIPIARPSIQEQQEVADILSLADQAIRKVDAIMAKTKRLKGGLKQELLTKGIGHTKFKFSEELGHQIPKQWDIMKIEDFADTTSGGTPSRDVKEYYKGAIPWVKSGELNDGFVYDTQEKITQKAVQDSSAKLFPRGTLLIAMYGATTGRTGVLRMDATTNQAVCAILPKKKGVDSNYLRHYLIFGRPRLVAKSSGGAQPNISQRIIRPFKVPVPLLTEQQSIARILGTLDEKLELEDEERARLQRIKQGLMELLLTGRIRVATN